MSESPSAPRGPFEILVPDQRDASRAAAFQERRIPAALGSHRAAAEYFQPDADLVDAVNVALAVGAPLLLTGEPGTGKTQVAYYLEWYFGPRAQVFPLYVRSSTTAGDLLYRFDAVGYLRSAQDPEERKEKRHKEDFVEPGPLWQAYEHDGPALVLIDEVDKASRDFPNDLLNVLDQHRFDVRETGQTVERRREMPPPLVVITSNSERRLPEPFLRRAIFHHIEFSEELLRRAVEARLGDFAELSEEVREAAIGRFLELRGREIRKRPATAELLVWLAVLAARGGAEADELRQASLHELPALACLVKDRDDLALLRR